MNKAIFIDKDGTLIKNIPYNINPLEIVLMRGAAKFLSCLSSADYKIIIITNQSGIARGYFSEEDLLLVKEKIRLLLSSAGVILDGFYYCPHHPEAKIEAYRKDCLCRKPKPGLFFVAASDFDLDLENSWMIGDILDDIEAGNRAGCKTILYSKSESRCVENKIRIPDFQTSSFVEMAKIIKKELWRPITVSKI